jgi:NAD(P)-dependent dehydrogenase (short-subunit alcohol dehydrogenase family)
LLLCGDPYLVPSNPRAKSSGGYSSSNTNPSADFAEAVVLQNVLVETADYPRDDYDRVMAVNLRGVWSCMKFELQQMRKQGSGAIVNCSSLGGLIGGAQRATYHAAKHGVIGLTRAPPLNTQHAAFV